MNTAEKIAVLQAAERVEKIQYQSRHGSVWSDVVGQPCWDFSACNYRVKPAAPLRCWVRVFDDRAGDDKFGSAYLSPAHNFSNVGRLVEFVEVVK